MISDRLKLEKVKLDNEPQVKKYPNSTYNGKDRRKRAVLFDTAGLEIYEDEILGENPGKGKKSTYSKYDRIKDKQKFNPQKKTERQTFIRPRVDSENKTKLDFADGFLRTYTPIKTNKKVSGLSTGKLPKRATLGKPDECTSRLHDLWRQKIIKNQKIVDQHVDSCKYFLFLLV